LRVVIKYRVRPHTTHIAGVIDEVLCGSRIAHFKEYVRHAVDAGGVLKLDGFERYLYVNGTNELFRPGRTTMRPGPDPHNYVVSGYSCKRPGPRNVELVVGSKVNTNHVLLTNSTGDYGEGVRGAKRIRGI
jgi:hypothetical protein